ncbi:MAG: hypothetical protein QW512_05405 [Thermofilaceae archaeon]
MDGVTQNRDIEQKSSIGSDRKIEVTEEEWEEDERDEWSESDYEQEEEQNEEQMEWTVAEILKRIENGVEYNWIMIFANDKDDDAWVWTKEMGWLLEPVPYNEKVKDFWLEKDEDGIGIKIILKNE